MEQPAAASASPISSAPAKQFQFHVRGRRQPPDEGTNLLLRPSRKKDPPPAIAFNCNGRGNAHCQRAGHDIRRHPRTSPTNPIAGFFAAGELGPIGRRNFIHGHTPASPCSPRERIEPSHPRARLSTRDKRPARGWMTSAYIAPWPRFCCSPGLAALGKTLSQLSNLGMLLMIVK